MRPLKKLLQKCQIENKDVKKELYQFLLNYRSSPHCVTGISPAKLLFNRIIRAKIPHSPQNPVPINKHKDLAGKENQRKGQRVLRQEKSYKELRNKDRRPSACKTTKEK